MNKRRKLVIAFGAGAITAPFASFAQQPGKVWRIGVLETTSMALNAANFNMFRKGLLELGYAEGKNLVIDYRSAEGSVARFPELATELVRLKVDLIVTRGTPALLAASHAAGTIPIVMAAIGEVPGHGIVASLAHPGGNVTGLTAFVTELTGKRLEMLRELIGKAPRVAFLADISNPISLGQWKETQAAAKLLGIQPQHLDVRKPEDLGRAFDDAIKQRANGLVVGIDALVQANRRTIVELAAKHRLPAIYASREFVDAGGLISYGVSYPDLYFRAAGHVDKIFKGKKPADIPVEQPTKYELVINGNAAKALGIKIPNSILVRTDKVIE
jgi:putative ABC transport system substrate-binding protein